MADISAEIAAFRDAAYGEEVRGSMISLAQKLNGNILSELDTMEQTWNDYKDDVDALVENKWAFIGLRDDVIIVYDYISKIITFPDGWYFIKGSGHSRRTSSIDLTDALTSQECCVLVIDDSGVISGIPWSTNYGDKYPIGYVYRDRVTVFGAENKVIVTNGPKAPLNNLPGKWCALCYGAITAVIEYDVTNKTVSFVDGGYIILQSAGRSSNFNSTVVSLPSNIAILLYNPVTGTVTAVEWASNFSIIERGYVLGWTYNDFIHINGIDNREISIVSDSDTISSYSYTEPAYYHTSNLHITYDYSTKTLTIPQGFITTSTRTYSFYSITKTFASSDFKYDALTLWLDRNRQLISAPYGSYAPKNAYYFFGMIYSDSVYINGIYSDDITIVNGSSGSLYVYCFGDSITAGISSNTQYHQIWRKFNKKYHFKNYGIGSTGYLTTTSANVRVGNGVEGRGDWRQESGSNTLLDVMSGLSDDMYAICLSAGTNDWHVSWPMTDFRTAFENTLVYALSKTNKVFVMTPIKRQNYLSTNSIGLYLKDYCDAIKEICDSYGVVCAIGFDVGINPANETSKTNYAPDGLHPNDDGQLRMARHYYNQLLEALND